MRIILRFHLQMNCTVQKPQTFSILPQCWDSFPDDDPRCWSNKSWFKDDSNRVKMTDYYPCKSTHHHSLLLYLQASERRLVIFTTPTCPPKMHLIIVIHWVFIIWFLMRSNSEKVDRPNRTLVWACQNRQIPILQSLGRLWVAPTQVVHIHFLDTMFISLVHFWYLYSKGN